MSCSYLDNLYSLIKESSYKGESGRPITCEEYVNRHFIDPPADFDVNYAKTLKFFADLKAAIASAKELGLEYLDDYFAMKRKALMAEKTKDYQYKQGDLAIPYHPLFPNLSFSSKFDEYINEIQAYEKEITNFYKEAKGLYNIFNNWHSYIKFVKEESPIKKTQSHIEPKSNQEIKDKSTSTSSNREVKNKSVKPKPSQEIKDKPTNTTSSQEVRDKTELDVKHNQPSEKWKLYVEFHKMRERFKKAASSLGWPVEDIEDDITENSSIEDIKNQLEFYREFVVTSSLT